MNTKKVFFILFVLVLAISACAAPQPAGSIVQSHVGAVMSVFHVGNPENIVQLTATEPVRQTVISRNSNALYELSAKQANNGQLDGGAMITVFPASDYEHHTVISVPDDIVIGVYDAWISDTVSGLYFYTLSSADSPSPDHNTVITSTVRVYDVGNQFQRVKTFNLQDINYYFATPFTYASVGNVSPDGRKLLLYQVPNGLLPVVDYYVASDTSKTTAIHMETEGFNPDQAMFSRDGQSVYYTTMFLRDGTELHTDCLMKYWLAGSSAGLSEKIACQATTDPNGIMRVNYDESTDGRILVYFVEYYPMNGNSNDGWSAKNSAFYICAKSSGCTDNLVTNSDIVQSAVWSPDGQWIAINDYHDGLWRTFYSKTGQSLSPQGIRTYGKLTWADENLVPNIVGWLK